MVGFDFLGMDQDQVIEHLVHQFAGHIHNAAAREGLDFLIINEWASVFDTQLTATDIEILNPERKCFSVADRAFVEQRQQQLVAQVITSAYQLLNLALGERLRSLPSRHLLFQEILFNLKTI